MKRLKYVLLLFFLFIANHANCQMEKYNSFEQLIYTDELNEKIIPSNFKDYYYSKIEKNNYNLQSQLIDTVENKRTLFIYTKKVKNGFLYVNKEIMNKIKESNYDVNNVSILYFQNGKVILSTKEVLQFIKLKKKDIISISIEEENSPIIIKANVGTR